MNRSIRFLFSYIFLGMVFSVGTEALSRSPSDFVHPSASKKRLSSKAQKALWIGGALLTLAAAGALAHRRARQGNVQRSGTVESPKVQRAEVAVASGLHDDERHLAPAFVNNVSGSLLRTQECVQEDAALAGAGGSGGELVTPNVSPALSVPEAPAVDAHDFQPADIITQRLCAYIRYKFPESGDFSSSIGKLKEVLSTALHSPYNRYAALLPCGGIIVYGGLVQDCQVLFFTPYDVSFKWHTLYASFPRNWLENAVVAPLGDVFSCLKDLNLECEVLGTASDFFQKDLRDNYQKFCAYNFSDPSSVSSMPSYVGVAEITGKRLSGPIIISTGPESVMEDVVAVKQVGSCSFFAVFDGHGDCGKVGLHCAAYLPGVLLGAMQKSLIDQSVCVQDQLVRAIKEFDSQLRSAAGSSFIKKSGCTMASLLYDHKTHCLHILNLGDSRVLVIDNDGHSFLSTCDHKFSEQEQKRVMNAGGYISVGESAQRRVMGALNVSRSLGDVLVQQQGWWNHPLDVYPAVVGMRPQVVSLILERHDALCHGKITHDSFYDDPNYYHVDRLTRNSVDTPNPNVRLHLPLVECTEVKNPMCDGADGDAQRSKLSRRLAANLSAVVIACDGLWDVMSNDLVAEFIHQKAGEGLTMQQISEALVREAYNRGSMDNISCVVINVSDLIKDDRS